MAIANKYATIANNSCGDTLVADLTMRTLYAIAPDGTQLATSRPRPPASREGDWSRIVPGSRIVELIRGLREMPVPIQCKFCGESGLKWMDEYEARKYFNDLSIKKWTLVKPLDNGQSLQHFCKQQPQSSEPFHGHTYKPSITMPNVKSQYDSSEDDEWDSLKSQVATSTLNNYNPKDAELTTKAMSMTIVDEINPPLQSDDERIKVIATNVLANELAQPLNEVRSAIKKYSDSSLLSVQLETRRQEQALDEKVKVGIEGLQEAVLEEIKNNLPVVHEYVIKTQSGETVSSSVIPTGAHYLTPLLMRYVAARVNVFLVGPAGGGKTTSGSIVAKTFNLPFYPKALSVSDDSWTLVGHLNPLSGAYVEGVTYKPFKDGGVLLLDEIDNSDPSAAVTLNAMLANGEYMFPNGELVKMHPDFICIASGNTFGRGAADGYVGRNPLDAATLDRFAILEWPYDESQEFGWVPGGASPHAPVHLELDDAISAAITSEQWVNYVQAVRHAVMKHKERYIVSPRASINGVKLLQAGVPVQYVKESCVWKGMPDDMRIRLMKDARVELESKGYSFNFVAKENEYMADYNFTWMTEIK